MKAPRSLKDVLDQAIYLIILYGEIVILFFSNLKLLGGNLNIKYIDWVFNDEIFWGANTIV